MNPQFLAMLPVELRAAVQEAEQVAGCEIAVVADEAANDFDSLAIGVENGACIATIAYRGKSISRCALLHEVLHVKRYWLDGAPMLRPTTRLRYESEAGWVNELFEHLIIIPEEQRFLEAESNAHWASVMANLLEPPRIGSPSSQADPGAFRQNLLLQRAMMDIALPGLDPTRLYDRLRNENLLEASAVFIEGLRGRLDDKERALIFVIQAFRYDLSGFCISQFNLRTDRKSVLYSDPLSYSPWANIPTVPS